MKYEIQFIEIKEFLEMLFEKFDCDSFLSRDLLVLNHKVKEPEFNLFLWAVLSNRIEIAKIFWRLGKVC